MTIVSRILRPIDRLIGLDQLRQAVDKQGAETKALIAQHARVRQILADALQWGEVSYAHCPTLASLAEKVKWYFDAERESNKANDIEIARLMRELDGARGACDRLRALSDKASQTISVRDADLADLKHALDQCEADRSSLAKERDQAIESRHVLAKAVDTARTERDAARADVGHRSQVAAHLQRNCGEHERHLADLRARIANAVDQLTGPREFAETKAVETPDSDVSIDTPTPMALDRMGPQWIKRWDTAV